MHFRQSYWKKLVRGAINMYVNEQIFVDWSTGKITHWWGSKFVAIVFSLIILKIESLFHWYLNSWIGPSTKTTKIGTQRKLSHPFWFYYTKFKAKQEEMLTPPRHLVQPLVSRSPHISIIILIFCSTALAALFRTVLNWYHLIMWATSWSKIAHTENNGLGRCLCVPEAPSPDARLSWAFIVRGFISMINIAKMQEKIQRD